MQVNIAVCGQQQQKQNQAEIYYKSSAKCRNAVFNDFKTWLCSESAQNLTISNFFLKETVQAVLFLSKPSV